MSVKKTKSLSKLLQRLSGGGIETRTQHEISNIIRRLKLRAKAGYRDDRISIPLDIGKEVVRRLILLDLAIDPNTTFFWDIHITW